MRQELSAAERAEHVARRKVLYEALHPETAHGAIGNGRQSRQSGDSTLPDRFTKATAEATGQSKRTARYGDTTAASICIGAGSTNSIA